MMSEIDIYATQQCPSITAGSRVEILSSRDAGDGGDVTFYAYGTVVGVAVGTDPQGGEYEQGGVNGRKLEVIVEDNRSEPQEAVTVYRKMMSSDKVDIFLSGCVSAGNLAAAAGSAAAQGEDHQRSGPGDCRHPELAADVLVRATHGDRGGGQRHEGGDHRGVHRGRALQGEGEQEAPHGISLRAISPWRSRARTLSR